MRDCYLIKNIISSPEIRIHETACVTEYTALRPFITVIHVGYKIEHSMNQQPPFVKSHCACSGREKNI